ncbi:MAG: hypothetical protein A2V98_17380 [Planctomycetes bacterium RBG_16_64_12]|nr:MAG: hypothetical protein A2V98_17380 [Planctomycetes bacterium RBG_16_64_12]
MLLPASAVVVFAHFADWPSDGAGALAAPPLSLDGYLDEKLPEAPKKDAAVKVDNSACYVCHGNYEEEELVVSHGKEKTGCIDCHGESLAHRNDEDNVVPPDKMYALSDVNQMCAKCHDTHNAPARKVLERWRERCPAKTSAGEIVCTDCHYRHRLAFRTVWWDKKTGKLIVREEGQRTKPALDLTRTDKAS